MTFLQLSEHALWFLNLCGLPTKSSPLTNVDQQDFTNKAVLAYECGYSERLVREEIGVGTAAGSDLEDSLVDTLQRVDLDECVLAVALIWITLGMLPKETSKRWTPGLAPAAGFRVCLNAMHLKQI